MTINVLVVDDDERWALLCAALLRPLGGKVRVAGTYAQAVVTLDQPNGFDLVVLDLNLPDSPTEATLDRIPEIIQSGRQVVVVSGSLPEKVCPPAIARGALGCIHKGDINLAQRLLDLCAAAPRYTRAGVASVIR